LPEQVRTLLGAPSPERGERIRRFVAASLQRPA
jgi:hypothetical protein